jgi:hypothetical protein
MLTASGYGCFLLTASFIVNGGASGAIDISASGEGPNSMFTAIWFGGDIVCGGAPTIMERVVSMGGAVTGSAISYHPSNEVTNNSNVAGATVMDALNTLAASQPPSLADVDAADNTLYYSTTASKLVYKDSGGAVNALY